jgi:hypothetical protein
VVLIRLAAAVVVATAMFLPAEGVLSSRPAGANPGTAVASGIFGTVIVIPTCPGPIGSASECAHPASLPIEVVKGTKVVVRTRSRANGSFRVNVRPGRYIVRAIAAAGRTRRVASKHVTVPAKGYVRATLIVVS